MTIFEFCAKNDTEIHTVWIPREQNTQADYLSRILDIDDWAISTEFFQFIDELYGVHTVWIDLLVVIMIKQSYLIHYIGIQVLWG